MEADIIEELDIKEFGNLGKEMIKKHGEMVDCLHVAIAKTNSLLFITHEGKIGVLKEFYENVDTFNHFSKVFS
ncbi:MAG: hypothetical protein HY051_02125 [Candidatus Aenigmarchaeota archaeon]|nr:hypothetical protein [Candidatus Aenigmarchaeota archaeon]